MTGYARVIGELEELAVFGIRPGLDRVVHLLDRLGAPQRELCVVHIAGTNGKGTTAACLAAIAAAHGMKVGLYTSPHLIDFRERIQIDGAPVDAPAVVASWDGVRRAMSDTPLTYFEATTVIAFDLLARAAVDLAVVESGLGGRLDATNVVVPRLAVITNVALDHERHLGSDPVSIAREKAGIIKPDAPALVGDPGPPPVRRVWETRARETGSRLEILGDVARWRTIAVEARGSRFSYASAATGPLQLAIPIPGDAFVADAALAIRAWETVAADRVIEIEPSCLERALAGTAPAGRMERHVVDGVPLWLDVAHNPRAIDHLAETMTRLDLVPTACVAGILADKPWLAMIDTLDGVAARTWLAALDSAEPARRLTAADVTGALATRPGTEWVERLGEAIAAARAAVAGGVARSVLVTGSFRTVAEALITLGLATPGEPYRRAISASAVGIG